MEVALSLSQETPEVAITMLTPPHEVGVSQVMFVDSKNHSQDNESIPV